ASGASRSASCYLVARGGLESPGPPRSDLLIRRPSAWAGMQLTTLSVPSVYQASRVSEAVTDAWQSRAAQGARHLTSSRSGKRPKWKRAFPIESESDSQTFAAGGMPLLGTAPSRDAPSWTRCGPRREREHDRALRISSLSGQYGQGRNRTTDTRIFLS